MRPTTGLDPIRSLEDPRAQARLTAVTAWLGVAEAALGEMRPMISDLALTPDEPRPGLPIFVPPGVLPVLADLTGVMGMKSGEVILAALMMYAQQKGIPLRDDELEPRAGAGSDGGGPEPR